MDARDRGGHLRQAAIVPSFMLVSAFQDHDLMHDTVPFAHEPGSRFEGDSLVGSGTFTSIESGEGRLDLPPYVHWDIAEYARLLLPGDAPTQEVGANVRRRLSPTVSPCGP
jgi:hypothetical protein